MITPQYLLRRKHQPPDKPTRAGRYSVAGWVAPVESWLEFETQWNAELTAWGSDFDHFHMTDFEGSYGPYAQWTPDEHRDRLNVLIDPIVNHTFAGIGASITDVLFESTLPSSLRDKVDPYHFLAVAAFLAGSKVLR